MCGVVCSAAAVSVDHRHVARKWNDSARGFIAYFSFFTILTNLIIAVGLTCSLLLADSRWGSFFSLSGTALYTAIVGALYSFLLRHLWNPEGSQKIADVLLHDVVPLAYVTVLSRKASAF
jgi:hypothetical protein